MLEHKEHSSPWYKTATKGMVSNYFLQLMVPQEILWKNVLYPVSPLLGGERPCVVTSILGTINFVDTNAYETGFVSCSLWTQGWCSHIIKGDRIRLPVLSASELLLSAPELRSLLRAEQRYPGYCSAHSRNLKQKITASKTAQGIYLRRYISGTDSTYEYLVTSVK